MQLELNSWFSHKMLLVKGTTVLFPECKVVILTFQPPLEVVTVEYHVMEAYWRSGGIAALVLRPRH
jgi:hypothetical protein